MEGANITVYLDADFVCHLTPAMDRVPCATSVFAGQEHLIPYYRLVPEGQQWQRADGTIFVGEMCALWTHLPL